MNRPDSVESGDPVAARSRSGSETRQSSARLDLRLLPSEHQALRVLADQTGHRSVQSWITATLRPHLDRVEHAQNDV